MTQTIGQLITLAYKEAGLMELSQTPTPAQFQYGKERLSILLDRMPNDGPAARVQSFYELTLTEDQFIYDVDTTIVDFLDPGMLIDSGQTDTSRATGETVVQLIDQRTWQTTGSKSAKGRPSLFYPHRVASQLQVYLWPIPDDTGSVIRFRAHRALSAATSTEAILDLEPSWYDWIVLKLASRLARAQSVESKASVLGAEAALEFDQARGQANHRGREQMVLDHPTGWEWRR